MSPRAKRVSRAYLDQIIREEIERQMETVQLLQDAKWPVVALNTITGFPCPDCGLVMVDMPDYLAHDLAAHIDERLARADARLRERKGKASTG